jgi:oligopeptide transport system substrate-binding protein
MMASSEAIGLGYHPDKARALWNETGVKLTFILPNTEKNLMTGQFIQEELKKNLGIEVTLQPFDNKTFRSELNLRKYPLFLMSWSADYPDPDNFLSIFLSESGNNRTHWKDAGFDQKVAEARGLRNQKDRKSIYLNLQKKLIEENVVVVPLYYEPNHALVRPYVKNLELNPLNYLDLRKVNLE